MNPFAKSRNRHPTDFRVLARLDESLALIEAIPKTGRHHQIRRHLLHAGHPIVGDYRYAGIERSDAWGERLGSGTRMFLHARSLRFTHPFDGNELHIEAPVDSLFRKVCGDRFGDWSKRPQPVSSPEPPAPNYHSW